MSSCRAHLTLLKKRTGHIWRWVEPECSFILWFKRNPNTRNETEFDTNWRLNECPFPPLFEQPFVMRAMLVGGMFICWLLRSNCYLSHRNKTELAAHWRLGLSAPFSPPSNSRLWCARCSWAKRRLTREPHMYIYAYTYIHTYIYIYIYI